MAGPLQDHVDHHIRSIGGVLPQNLKQTVLAEFILLQVHRLRDAIRIEQERIARLQMGDFFLQAVRENGPCLLPLGDTSRSRRNR